MNIVVLDGYRMNPGDLSWDGLRGEGNLTVYDRSVPEEVAERAAGAQLVLTNKSLIPRQAIEQLPLLEYIGVMATGYNVVDVAAAAERNVVVTNVPTYGTPSVAQMVFAHILNLTQQAACHSRTVGQGKWSNCIDFCYWDTPQVELAGLTLGSVGLGKIGTSVVEIAHAFGMKVIASVVRAPANLPDWVELVELEQLFRISDVLTLNCNLTNENRQLVNRERLALMKKTALFINTARGPLVDEQALADTLNEGGLAGAGLDVLTVEPPRPDNPLFTARNCYITPHMSWGTVAARTRLMNTVVENVQAFLKGAPQNTVGAK